MRWSSISPQLTWLPVYGPNFLLVVYSYNNLYSYNCTPIITHVKIPLLNKFKKKLVNSLYSFYAPLKTGLDLSDFFKLYTCSDFPRCSKWLQRSLLYFRWRLLQSCNRLCHINWCVFRCPATPQAPNFPSVSAEAIGWSFGSWGGCQKWDQRTKTSHCWLQSLRVWDPVRRKAWKEMQAHRPSSHFNSNTINTWPSEKKKRWKPRPRKKVKEV